MKRIQTHQITFNRKIQYTLLATTLSFLFIMSGFVLPLTAYHPVGLRTTTYSESMVFQTAPYHAPMRAQNFTLEGEADLTAFVVNPDGSMTSTIMAVGDVGDYTTSAPPYQECLLALSIFRWGEYQTVLDGLLSIITNDSGSGGGAEIDMLYEILDMLPPNAILMVFMGGSPTEIQNWGHAIHLEFETTLATPFERIFGLSLPISNMTLGLEAYGFYGVPSEDPVAIQGRNQFQSYMENLGESRNGGTELVTSTLAEDSIGGIGLSGFINLAVMGSSPSPLPMKSVMQIPEAITFAAWGSQHRDKFFGTTEQTFDVNAFTGHTGNIELGTTLEAFEFTMLFPAGVNITSYTPTDMVNTTGPEGPMVIRSTGHWLNDSSVSNIIVNFEGDFPPGLSVTKSITTPIIAGGTAEVTITLENIDPTQTVYNVNLDDSQSWILYQGYTYGEVSVTGSLTANWSSITPGNSVNHTYQIRVFGEGSYIALRTNVSFEDALSRVWYKSSNEALLTVLYGSLIDFILTIMRDIPWSIPVILIILIIAIYALIWLIKGVLGIFPRGGPSPSQPSPAPPPKAEPPPEELPPPPDEYDAPAKDYPETTCFNCGALVPPGVSFCPACGTKIM
ncbi:MAG: zinc ribbon domain-containing protein [Promethearchaeota archaeon]